MVTRRNDDGVDNRRDSARGFEDETGLPVIELIDVVEEGAEKATDPVDLPEGAAEDPEELSIEKILDAALDDVGPEPVAGTGPGDENQETPPELPPEDFSSTLDAGDDFTFTGGPADSGTGEFEGLTPLDERKLETLISRIVEDVVTRVTRETVAQVTEKVLTAAIEAIRDNMEHPPE